MTIFWGGLSEGFPEKLSYEAWTTIQICHPRLQVVVLQLVHTLVYIGCMYVHTCKIMVPTYCHLVVCILITSHWSIIQYSDSKKVRLPTTQKFTHISKKNSPIFQRDVPNPPPPFGTKHHGTSWVQSSILNRPKKWWNWLRTHLPRCPSTNPILRWVSGFFPVDWEDGSASGWNPRP